MKKLILISCLIILFGCGHKHHKQIVKCYKTHSISNTGDNFWLYYYYLFWSADHSSCYYYSSLTPIYDYSSVNWTQSVKDPLSSFDQTTIETLPEQQVSSNQFNEEMQTEMDTTPENFEGMTADEMGDYEGGTESSGSDADSDGDSGGDGGDSGGGDGGGE